MEILMTDLIAFVNDGWLPRLRAAPSTRAWMDELPDKFGYRCLPLNIANAHGWEILNACDFSARWNGGPSASDVEINVHTNNGSGSAPVTLFGAGTITFHIMAIFRTSPGWNMWIGGSPNSFKDGIQALTGIVETDWSVFSFTMNWKITRPHHWISFAENEPMCFLFPVQRHLLQTIQPEIKHFREDPEFAEQFRLWSTSRDAFHEKMRTNPPPNSADAWQKDYYRGRDMRGNVQKDHVSRLRLADFSASKPVSS
jgi:hypothetical protein